MKVLNTKVLEALYLVKALYLAKLLYHPVDPQPLVKPLREALYLVKVLVKALCLVRDQENRRGLSRRRRARALRPRGSVELHTQGWNFLKPS